MNIKWHGHACFEISDGSATLLVDPFLKPNNPSAVHTADEVEPTHVLQTHGHMDHIADTVDILKRTGAVAVAHTELADWLSEEHGIENALDPNLGGTVEFDWGWVKLVQAFHSNTTPDGMSIGQAAGLIINIGGKTIYHAGDTCLFGDMQLIALRTPVDVAILPIGGHYTMDRHDAAYAAGLVGAGTVIPCHFDTFAPIETEVEAFKVDVEAQSSSDVVILAPGETHEL